MEQDSGASAPNGWSGLGAIAALRKLNVRCIEALAVIGRTENPLERSMIYRESELWSRMDQRACERAGSSPVLLLNLKFEQLEWWKRVCAGNGGPSPPDAPPTLFGEYQGEPLLREILTEVGVWADRCRTLPISPLVWRPVLAPRFPSFRCLESITWPPPSTNACVLDGSGTLHFGDNCCKLPLATMTKSCRMSISFVCNF